MSPRNILTFGLAIICSFILLVFFKVTFEARREYRTAEEALQAKNIDEAITHFNRAIHWYTPVSSPVRKSIERLWEIGAHAEKNGDYPLALRAYQELRSSLYSARSFYTPCPEWIERCDERIASIISEGKIPPPPERKDLPLDSKEEVLKILKTKTEPDYIWSIICEIGFIGWIACTIGFILFVFAGEKGFLAKRAFVWGALVIIFYAVWVVGMLQA